MSLTPEQQKKQDEVGGEIDRILTEMATYAKEPYPSWVNGLEICRKKILKLIRIEDDDQSWGDNVLEIMKGAMEAELKGKNFIRCLPKEE